MIFLTSDDFAGKVNSVILLVFQCTINPRIKREKFYPGPGLEPRPLAFVLML